jgi:CRISPR/Cas system-associated exonuclease Cas4 (RecB family)
MVKELKPLRFDKQILFVNEIAAQYFCEKKVDMLYSYGRVETESKDRGTAAHEKLVEDSEKVSIEKVWEEIHLDKPVEVHEMPLMAEYEGLPIMGRPDCVLFDKGEPALVLEFKFSSFRRPFHDHHIQAGAYCFLLEKMGFDVEKLHYGIVMAGTNAREDQGLTKRVIDSIVEKGAEESILEIENTQVYLSKYDVNKVTYELDWATKYWKQEREAIPTNNPNKCRRCEYNNRCENSLTKD